MPESHILETGEQPETAMPGSPVLETAELARAVNGLGCQVKILVTEAQEREQMVRTLVTEAEVGKQIMAQFAAKILRHDKEVNIFKNLVKALKAKHDKEVQMLTALVENLNGRLEISQEKLEIAEGKLDTLELNLAEFMKTVEEQMPQSVASTPTAAPQQHQQPPKSEAVKSEPSHTESIPKDATGSETEKKQQRGKRSGWKRDAHRAASNGMNVSLQQNV